MVEKIVCGAKLVLVVVAFIVVVAIAAALHILAELTGKRKW